MNSNPFWKLLGGLALAFLIPWSLLVVKPFLTFSSLKSTPYEEDDKMEEVTNFPDMSMMRHGSSDFGMQVYASEGCAYCHTQVVRPTYAGPDMWRIGWGGREEGGFARETLPYDYMMETYAPLGYQRIGQDLSNVGHRITTRELMHRHLLDPKSIDPDSGMPSYRYLYSKSPYGEGYIPGPKADALVDYLLSLKKDQKVPQSMAKSQ